MAAPGLGGGGRSCAKPPPLKVFQKESNGLVAGDSQD